MSDWIEWGGGSCPVDSNAKVEVKFRAIDTLDDYERAGSVVWHHDGEDDDIIAYRLLDEPDAQPTTKQPSSEREKYPLYFKDVSELTEVDVYMVCEIFGIDDHSGSTHHAIKKLLLSGVRTGGKSVKKDISEARDTLTRKLQIMEITGARCVEEGR